MPPARSTRPFSWRRKAWHRRSTGAGRNGATWPIWSFTSPPVARRGTKRSPATWLSVCLASQGGQATTGQIAEWCRPEIVYAGGKPTAIQIAKHARALRSIGARKVRRGGGRQWPCSFRQPYWETDNIVEPTLARRLSIGKREQGRNNGVNGLTCVSECGARSSWRSQSPLLKTRSSVVPGGIGTMKLPASLNPLPAKKLPATSRGNTAR